MSHKSLKVAARALVLAGGTIRLALAGIGVSMAAFLMIDKIRHRRHDKHALPYEKIREALKR
ncbi:MAG: hypothetical protein P8Y63_10650 [Deltaproteobacteria bacterium]|jgi:hypothetical protein